MEREIKYHPKALAEAFKSARYYNRRSPGLGAEFFEEIDLVVRQPDANGMRSWPMKRFWFRIYYFLDPNRIRILAVAHPKRRSGYWRQRMRD